MWSKAHFPFYPRKRRDVISLIFEFADSGISGNVVGSGAMVRNVSTLVDKIHILCNT